MAVGIARSTLPCLVCGKMIQAGKDIQRWQGGKSGSTRHDDCYGKPDQYTFDGVRFHPLSRRPDPIIPPSDDDSPLPKPGVREPIKDYQPIPVEPKITPEDGNPPWDVAQSVQSPDPVLGLLISALTPRLERALREQFVTERDVKRILATAETGLTKPEVAQIVDEILPSRGFVEINVRVVVPLDRQKAIA